MEITKLTPQVRNPERVNLFIDGQFYRGLDRLVAIKLGLRPGLTLTPQLLGRLETTQSENSAWEWALRSLQASPKSQREMGRRLKQKFEPALAKALFHRLMAAGLLDDKRLGEALVDKYVRQGRSRKEISLRLLRKGIDRTTAQTALGERHDDVEQMIKLAQVKDHRLKADLPWRERFEKIAGYLARKGFGYSDIRQAVTKTNLESDTE